MFELFRFNPAYGSHAAALLAVVGVATGALGWRISSLVAAANAALLVGWCSALLPLPFWFGIPIIAISSLAAGWFGSQRSRATIVLVAATTLAVLTRWVLESAAFPAYVDAVTIVAVAVIVVAFSLQFFPETVVVMSAIQGGILVTAGVALEAEKLPGIPLSDAIGLSAATLFVMLCIPISATLMAVQFTDLRRSERL